VNARDDQYRKAAAGYSVSLMNDTKWRKLFKLLHRAGVRIDRATWHFIDATQPMLLGLPRENELDETRFRDGRFQPFEYKWIRSIEIPREYRPIANVGYAKQQPVDKVAEVLADAGQFPIENTAEGIKIVAYRK
jgi:hypothetical protein